jgi:hypothetical protein
MKIIYIAPYKQTKYLVLSSYFFIIPALYAIYKKLFYYSSVLVLTSIISANYWRKATYSWRRTLDLIFAKFSFIVFVINGIIYIKYIPYVVIGYPLCLVLSYCYYLSGKLLEEKNNNWYKYHFLFHLLMTIEQIIIIDSIIN